MKLTHKFMTKWLALMLTGGILWGACAVDQTARHDAADAHDDHDAERVVPLSQEQLDEFGIELARAESGGLKIQKAFSGEIVIEPDRLAHIVPRFPGIVTEVHKHIGDKVRAGEVLAVIESNESLAPYEVKSLIAGTVTDKHLTLGEVITDNSHAFTITDLSSVWANLSIYQKDLAYVKPRQKVVISAGADMPEATGTISYISPFLEEATRTATARVVLSNPDGRLRPGLFITGYVDVDSAEATVVIPRTALQSVDDHTVVFVQTGRGFVPQPVTLGKGSKTHVEILAGLQPGQTYVRKGGFTLKAQLARGSFASGHAH